MSKRVTRGSLKKQLEADPGMVANNAALEADVAKFKKAVAESRVKKPSVNFTVVDASFNSCAESLDSRLEIISADDLDWSALEQALLAIHLN